MRVKRSRVERRSERLWSPDWYNTTAFTTGPVSFDETRPHLLHICRFLYGLPDVPQIQQDLLSDHRTFVVSL